VFQDSFTEPQYVSASPIAVNPVPTWSPSKADLRHIHGFKTDFNQTFDCSVTVTSPSLSPVIQIGLAIPSIGIIGLNESLILRRQISVG
jgi:hypothetical protein